MDTMKPPNYGTMEEGDGPEKHQPASKSPYSSDRLNRQTTSKEERSLLVRIFDLDRRKTTVYKEVRAGITTFLTMAYVLVVNPEILGRPRSALERSDVVLATALSSALASFVIGIFGNLPFGCAPGLGLSAYLSYGLIGNRDMSLSNALSLCYFSGIIMFFLGITRLSEQLMKLIPKTIKLATVAGMGLLLSFIGMQEVHMVVAADDGSLVTLGSLQNWNLWLCIFGLLFLATLTYYRIKGAVLIGIFTITMIVWMATNSAPSRIFQLPDFSQVREVYREASDLRGFFAQSHWTEILPPAIAFIAVGIFDVSGVMFGCAKLANLYDDQKDKVPGSKWAFLSTALGTMVAALLGCSPIIIHIESVAGIKEGGRTGLTAVTVAFMFLISVFFVPLLSDIPSAATAPVLLLIGTMMMGSTTEIDWKSMYEAVPAFLTLVTMPLTFSIPNGIFFGTLAHITLFFSTGKCLEVGETDDHGSEVHDMDARSGHQLAGGIVEGRLSRLSNEVKRRASSLLDTETYTRKPSLLLREEEYEQLKKSMMTD